MKRYNYVLNDAVEADEEEKRTQEKNAIRRIGCGENECALNASIGNQTTT
jgi:hypothetical protein